jgi:hypothetical protein
MSDEIVRMRGRLAEAEREYGICDTDAGVDIDTARRILDPYEPNILKIKVEEAILVVGRLQGTIKKMRVLYSQITELKEALK